MCVYAHARACIHTHLAVLVNKSPLPHLKTQAGFLKVVMST